MLDGHGRVEEYLERAKSLGMRGLATTDHGNIHSWLDFYDAGKAVGVKPILGSEFYQARKTRFDKDEEERSGPAKNEWEQRGPYHITILAKNNTGYNNIIKLSSRSYLEGYYVKPRVDHDLIAEHSEGIIVLSGCLNSEVCQALLRDDYQFALASAKKMQDIVGKENYFIEVQDHGLREQKKVFNQLVQIAETIGAKIVPTGDCHYVHKHDARAHDIMLCVATNCNIHTPNRFSFSGDEFYLQSYDEMNSRFSHEWLKNSMDICDMVDVDLSFGNIYFPNFPIPTQEPSVDYFERLAWQGLKERYGDPLPQHIIDRAIYEIRVVKEMGFPEYFLVVSDLVNWAKDNDIRVGWGRGSAAGSVLSYAFNITNLDPIKFGLMFERFLVEGRKSMPDIDLDFDDRHRDKVIEYARNKYGHDHVAHICTFNKTGARQSIRDAARALGYDFSGGDSVAKLVPPPVLGVSKTLTECMDVAEFKSLYEKDNNAKEIVDAAFGLEGLVRQTGMHAAGIVISRDALIEYLPIMQKGVDNPIITQWDMGRVEQCGLLKIDFLGLRNLGVIDSCIKLVKKHRGIDIDVNDIPITDEKTYEELCKGNSAGVFQLESSGMRQLMTQLQPKNIQDIMALISLYRPGPMGSGMDKEYIDRKHGRSTVRYEHPKLEKVLSPSLGIMLYQEDVLGVARELAGFTSAEADDLRKVIGKKLMDKIASMRSKFVDGCVKYSEIDERLANKIFSDIEYFGGYGFNRAHAASYAMISYITAYLKTNYTVEYMAALMSSVVGNKDKQSLYLADCRKMGVNVLPPSINYSGIDFEVIDDNKIIFGLSAISGIGDSIAENIVEARDKEKPYLNIYDFFRRCDPITLKKSTIEHLAAAGALDELFSNFEDIELNRIQEISILEKEKEELGIYVTDHPVNGVWDILSKKITCEIIQLSEIPSGSNVKVGGIVTDIKSLVTKKGAKMYKLILEDISSDVEIIIFPNSAKALSESSIKKGDILIISGSINRESEEENLITKIFFNSYETVDSRLFSSGKAMVFTVNRNISPSTISKIYDIIESSKGDKPVYIEMQDGSHKYIYKFNKNTSLKTKNIIENILKMEDINV
jgi:DNA polymerase-3 subunit alpha